MFPFIISACLELGCEKPGDFWFSAPPPPASFPLCKDLLPLLAVGVEEVMGDLQAAHMVEDPK